MFEKGKEIRILAIFLIFYLSVRAILTGRGIVLRIHMRLGDLRLSSYSYNRAPRRKNRTSSKITPGVEITFVRCHVMEPQNIEPKIIKPGSTFRGSMLGGSSKDEGSYIYVWVVTY
jgi:hypothetical protein